MQNNSDLRQEWTQMPTSQLKAILKAETQKPEPDDDLVLTLLHILDHRRKEEPVELSRKEQAAWKEYRASAVRRGYPAKRVLRTLGAVAAAVVLVLVLAAGALPQEASAGGIFDVISWCNEVALRLFAPGKVQAPAEYVFHTEHPGLQKLRDTLVEYGYDGPGVPMWIPEEYSELSRLEVDDASRCKTVTAGFSSGSGELVISISLFDTTVPQGYYKNDPDAQELELYGILHYLMQNRENCTATWIQDNIAGYIALNCQEEVLRDILKTIYAMEAN